CARDVWGRGFDYW
nr:immunoglobulin heavy chain junction region [Macaca mulatta]MOX59208.1 immunoglobulin heavy chain junction region [Macaca mulatta]MOX59359.1 immunoglobulin heavy chain junction region [Macaca mulatta]MOX59371.1 immunoglobulin heavy chain junction region [Macaca mulatta]MOX59769.1 immunoglobulin heavy chain junction region [Macaca mulatta]